MAQQRNMSALAAFCLLLAVAGNLKGAESQRQLLRSSQAHQPFVLNPTSELDEGGHPKYVHPKTTHWRARSLMYQIDPAVKITVSSLKLTTSPTTFTVSWTGVTKPNGNDLVGVWSPGENDPTTVAPYSWQSANTSDYLKTGSGSVNITVYNLRNNYRFRLIAGTPYTPFPNPTVIAESDLVINTIPNLPTQVHLSVYNDSASIVVQFVTNTSVSVPVQYGMKSGSYAKSVSSKAAKYSADMMCGTPAQGTAFTDPGYTHTAVIPASDIGHNKRIYYQIGNKDTGLTREFSFLSPPGKGADSSIKFLVFNDVGSTAETLFNDTCICVNQTTNGTSCTFLGAGVYSCCTGYCPIPAGTPEGQQWYLAMVNYTYNSAKLAPVLVAEEKDANLAILNGDLSYAQGYTDSWDIFGHQFEDAFSSWPLATGTGNHEKDFPVGPGTSGAAFDIYQGMSRDSGGECNVPYTYRYYNPGPGEVLDPTSSYYTFHMGPVAFLILDTEASTAKDSAQGKWVKQTLDSIDYKQTPWVVVSTHRMMLWPSTDPRPVQGDNAVSERLLGDLEDLFHGKVHFVVAGHQHAYGRTCPVYKYKCEAPASSSFIHKPSAPVYVLTGNAGAGFTHSFPTALPEWVAFGAQDINGYVRFQADKHTITMEAIAADKLTWFQGSKNFTFPAGSVIDAVTLSK